MILRHIRYLIAVAEHGNFTRAAEALHVSQPTLSQQIRQLEDMVGAPLLDRSGRTVRPTDAGAAYLEYAQRALRELAAAQRATHEVADLSRGTLRLAMTPTFTCYLQGPLLERYSARHPGVRLEIREMTQDAMEAALAADELDLGVAFDTAGSPEIERRPLFAEKLCVVAGPRHRWRELEQPLDARELEQAPLALLSADFATRGHIDEHFRRLGIAPRVAMEANTIGAILEAVRRGVMATILPEAIARQDPALQALELRPALPSRTAALLCRRDGFRSAAARACLPLLDELAEQLA
ncbi:transcriptional regulator CynR [Chromobacterium sp. IIBBL 290-4]|uniref:transcriptional regulator CynR n=1 Tax=Chromobacterium sp. IIBBL 290-4 TaxID=2953890 RepID=UPI0020B75C0A|nr:transcriptional regulator CynR [Chromobacterium sp. IIBBL 290-4]UTH75268.1 transcriptional regulator CynR [Chromobacterium sp. IIBBL 290-4]